MGLSAVRSAPQHMLDCSRYLNDLYIKKLVSDMAILLNETPLQSKAK